MTPNAKKITTTMGRSLSACFVANHCGENDGGISPHAAIKNPCKPFATWKTCVTITSLPSNNQQPSLDTASIRRRATSGSIQHGMACPICRGPITTNWTSAHGRNEPGSTRSFQSRQTSQSPIVDAQQSIPGHQECLYHFIASTNSYVFGAHLQHCLTRTLKTLV